MEAAGRGARPRARPRRLTARGRGGKGARARARVCVCVRSVRWTCVGHQRDTPRRPSRDAGTRARAHTHAHDGAAETCKHQPKADPYQCGGTTAGYLVYRDAFRTFFSGGDYDPVEVGFRLSNIGIQECTAAFADALQQCVEEGRIRGRHALPPGMGHAVAPAGTPFEEGLVDDFLEVVRIAVYSVFGTCNNAVMPLWHAQHWTAFLWNAAMRLMREAGCPQRAARPGTSASPMVKEWYLRTSIDLLIRLTRAVPRTW